MDRLKQLDALELPEDLEEADAEYFRIKISRCKNEDEAKIYRKQLDLIVEALSIKHQERVKRLK